MSNSNKTPEFYDAFISYRHKTGFYVARLIYDYLERNGYHVFLDKQLEGGEYEKTIKHAINHSHNFIIVLFPQDLKKMWSKSDWLNKEATWASETPGIRIIPVMTGGFKWPKFMPPCLKNVNRNNGVVLHYDNALDQDLDMLCSRFLANVYPFDSAITISQFFNKNINCEEHLELKCVDIACHGGGAWQDPNRRKGLLDEINRRKIPLRILINTTDAAERVTKHMRDADGGYVKFSDIEQKWKQLCEKNDNLEVKRCPIPLMHAYHRFGFYDKAISSDFGRMHVKYYTYKNTDYNNTFEHEISIYSKYYDLYKDEFEYLWEISEKL